VCATNFHTHTTLAVRLAYVYSLRFNVAFFSSITEIIADTQVGKCWVTKAPCGRNYVERKRFTITLRYAIVFLFAFFLCKTVSEHELSHEGVEGGGGWLFIHCLFCYTCHLIIWLSEDSWMMNYKWLEVVVE
jgi:dolichol kinase